MPAMEVDVEGRRLPGQKEERVDQKQVAGVWLSPKDMGEWNQASSDNADGIRQISIPIP